MDSNTDHYLNSILNTLKEILAELRLILADLHGIQKNLDSR